MEGKIKFYSSVKFIYSISRFFILLYVSCASAFVPCLIVICVCSSIQISTDMALSFGTELRIA